MPIFLETLLQKIPKDTEERVDKTRKRINSTVREAIRQETGLALNRTGDDTKTSGHISVPVYLEPGIPEALKETSFDDDFDLLLKISPFRRELEMARAGLKGIEPLIKSLTDNSKGLDLLNRNNTHLKPTHDLIDCLLNLLDQKDPVGRILEVNKDVLGAYFYRVKPKPQYSIFEKHLEDPFSARIRLYWGVIGLVAGMLGVSIESLTAVVLVHEIAHAYTHLGADIDGERWSSIDFSESEHELKEGLAQYYTHIICKRLSNQMPTAFATFEALLKHQPDAYHSHKPMIEDFKPEEIRLSLIEVRRHGKSDLDFFLWSLEKSREQLRRGATTY